MQDVDWMEIIWARQGGRLGFLSQRITNRVGGDVIWDLLCALVNVYLILYSKNLSLSTVHSPL